MNLIDDVINEPLIGAHRDKIGAINALGEYFLEQVSELKNLSSQQRYQKRYGKTGTI